MKTNAHYVYLALGRPNTQRTSVSAQISLLLACLMILSTKYGVMGASMPTCSLRLCLLRSVSGPSLEQSALRYATFSVVWRPVVSATFMFAIIRLITPQLPPEPPDNLPLAILLLT